MRRIAANFSGSQVLSFGPFNAGDVLEGLAVVLTASAGTPGVSVGAFPRAPTAAADFDGGDTAMSGFVLVPPSVAGPFFLPVEHKMDRASRYIGVLLDAAGCTGSVWLKVWNLSAPSRVRAVKQSEIPTGG